MIDKSIRANYDIKNRRRYFTGAFGGGGGRGRDPGPSGPPGGGDRGMTYSAPAPSPHRDPAPVAPTAVAPPSILSRPTPSATIGPSLHGDTSEQKEADELNRQKAIRDIIKQGQEEKYGDTADPTKFGETISDIDRITSKPESDWTIDDKLAIEEWEKDQDWEKVEELADRGHSSEDIQSAMNKGLLLKEDAIRRQGLIERGLAAVMPKTKLENSLLGSLKKTFDPKRLATNFALKKLGLSWLNPVAGLASLFFPKQTAAVKSKFGFGQQPKDMSAFNKLGLLADRQPTDTIRQARVGEGTIGGKIVSGEVDLAKLISGDNRTLVADINMPMSGLVNYEQYKENVADWPELGLEKQFKEEGLTTPKQQKQFFDVFGKSLKEQSRGLKKQTPNISTEDIQKAMDQGLIMRSAEGGRIDKPLTGRSRDI